MLHIAPNGFHDWDNVGFLGEFFDAEQTFKLLKSDGDSSTCHKSYNCGMWEEVDQEPQPAFEYKKNLCSMHDPKLKGVGF